MYRVRGQSLEGASNTATMHGAGRALYPDHELSPTEHQFSQNILEFLIADQVWFMLDTPPPPAFPPTPSRSITPPATSSGASTRTTVSDGEGPNGWCIIQRYPALRWLAVATLADVNCGA
ncbi:hypothetical protein EI94DRAFT_1798730 [Lactarius quietus]|nr:hypothetical protein EI94DRAFT_1798730 [Lactarius quietus]